MSNKCAMFCCENSAALAVESVNDPEILSEFDIVTLPCSGRIESALVLKTLERGYSGIVVLGCPEDNCKYVTGNKRAANRVAEVRSILTSAGLNGNAVTMDYVSSVDGHKVDRVMRTMIEQLQPAPQAE